MKLKNFEFTVSAVTAIGTVFLGVSGYLSVRVQAYLLGISEGALSSNWRYVLEAAEFTGVLILLLLLGSIAMVFIVTASVMVQHLFPQAARVARVCFMRGIRSRGFAVAAVAVTLLFALAAASLLMNERPSQAIGTLQLLRQIPNHDTRFEGVFLCSGLLVFCWLALVAGPARRQFGWSWVRHQWLWGLAAPGLVVVALVLPLAYGAGIRERTFVTVRMVDTKHPENTACGLLIERNDKRAAFWTVVRMGQSVVGVVRDVPLNGVTLDLGPALDIRQIIKTNLAGEPKDVVCTLLGKP